MNKKKVLFIDLDVITETVSGDVFPRDITDFHIRKDVLDKISSVRGLQRIVIVSNEEIGKELNAIMKSVEFFLFVYLGLAVSTYSHISEDIIRALPHSLRKREQMVYVGSEKAIADEFDLDYMTYEELKTK